MKNKKTITFLILAIIVIAIASLLVGGFFYALRQENLKLTRGNLVYLQETIAAYKQDAEKAGKASVYPETLKALVDENYLANADLRELTEGAVVEYFKPKQTNNPSEILLKATVGSDIYVCPLTGPVKRQ